MRETKKKDSPSQLISMQIAKLDDWRGDVYLRVRELINEAVPGISEAWKWNTAVWESDGLVCAVGAFKDHVKINFFKGASLADPKGLFNAGLDAKGSRAIDIGKGAEIDEPALKELVRKAAAYNRSGKN